MFSALVQASFSDDLYYQISGVTSYGGLCSVACVPQYHPTTKQGPKFT